MDPHARSGGFTLRTACSHCGQPLPLNAPVRRATCAACSGDVVLPDGIWTAALDELEKSYDQLSEDVPRTQTTTIDGFPLTFEVRRAAPKCEKCGQRYPEDRTQDGSLRDLFCVGCGDPGSTYPAPDWLRGLVPTAVQIVSTDPGGAAQAGLVPAGGVAASPRQAAAPVVMTCPQCGGPLRITDDMARLVPCQHCHAEVYLPDELWRRLHPTKVARLWYVRFEGKSRWMAREEAAEQARLARVARAQEDERQRTVVRERREAEAEETARVRGADVARLVSNAYLMVGVACFVLLVACVWNLASGPSSGFADLHLPVGIALGVASLITLVVALAITGMPIKRRTSYSADAMVFVVWFFAIFGFVMPGIGQIMCLVVAFKRFGGRVGGDMGEINGSAVSAPIVQLEGESVPLGLVYLVIALLWPAVIASLVLMA